MCRTPSKEDVRAVLSTALPDVTVKSVQAIPSPRLQRLYEVSIDSNDGTLLLVLAPPHRVRLLRSEQLMVESEAVTLRWIRETLLSRRYLGTDGAKQLDAAAVEKHESDRADQQPAKSTTSSTDILRYMPALVHLQVVPSPDRPTCSFYESKQGTPIISLVPGGLLLNPAEKQGVDKQLGSLLRQLAQLISPSGRFGPAAAVLSSSSSLKTIMGVDGTESWSAAFHLMLEGILRDGEDMAVMIGYSAIRRHFRRFRYLLDSSVTIPRLVVIDGAEELNIMVSTPSTSATSRNDSNKKPEQQQSNPTILQATSQISLSAETAEQPIQDDGGATTADEKTGGQEEESVRGAAPIMALSGLRDWSNCIFGDPLLATVFSTGPPSTEFLEGFNGSGAETEQPARGTGGTASSSKSSPSSYSSNLVSLLNKNVIVEDAETASIRLLLYQVYHASVSIVREFYRPRRESSRRELEARKRLTEALAKLELVPDDPKRSHSRPSGEMSSAKRAKQDASDGY
ncbi:hypothetical protein B0H66DRAFT_601585 [Apodospora peruviana]|uniref:Uncharacterized protein n=1 Tax=Apodospora peruviana TaxID=516989 RepID=A0AAE0IBX4_9PEZI|nr:hypothetical protein B0H66DRAFT_601585 [Apodospora peruviana]